MLFQCSTKFGICGDRLHCKKTMSVLVNFVTPRLLCKNRGTLEQTSYVLVLYSEIMFQRVGTNWNKIGLL